MIRIVFKKINLLSLVFAAAIPLSLASFSGVSAQDGSLAAGADDGQITEPVSEFEESGATLPSATTGGNLAGIRFTDDMWDADALSFLAIEPVYIPKDRHFEIPPYPHNDSDETQAELKILRDYAASERSPEIVSKIESEAIGIQTDLSFGLGGELPLQVMEAVDNLRYETLREIDYVIYTAKMSYKRPRPTQLDPMLSTVIAVPGHPSYPSGHAAEFLIIARIFGYVDPENAATYESIARDVGHRREIAGVHFPSDTKAGQDLAEDVFAALLENPDYRAKIDGLRDDYASVLKESE